MIPPETLTRVRNAFARLALDWIEAPSAAAIGAASALPFSSMSEADWRDAVRLWRVHAADLLKDLPARPCPACGSDQSRLLFHTYDAHPQHECQDCGCWFVPLVVDSAVFERFFERSPEAAALADRMMSGRDRAEGREADMARVGGYLDDLLPLLPSRNGAPVSYLDTGCGVGHSLRAGLARGLVVQGIEVDRTAIALARADGLPVAALGEPVPPGPYQLLSFWETLEHIAEPLQALREYLPLLAPGGLVAITVPNLNALATRVLRESCPWVHGGYNTPGHVNLFHARSLERLLSRAGLTLLDADGQFSANPTELIANLAGETRGAFDTLDPSLARGTLPSALVAALDSTWPGAGLLERIALASPILRIVACRHADAPAFAAPIAEQRRRRRQDITTQARAMIDAETDYRAMSVTLQAEVDRQSAVAVGLQAEVDRRDAIIRTTITAMQAEIERRDALSQAQLREAWARFDYSVNGRVIAARRKFGQLTDRVFRRRGDG